MCFTFPESNLEGMKGDTQLNQKLKKKTNQQPTNTPPPPPPKPIQPKKDKEKKEHLGQSKNQHLLTWLLV